MMKSACFDRPRPARVLAILALVLSFAAGAAGKAPATAQLRVGAATLHVEIASTDPQREKGLMHRDKLARNDGMLFVFDEPAYHAMWMKNTLIALSVAFVDAKGEILNILDMEPQTLDTHMAAGPATYAIETNKGWFAEHGVKAGDKVAGLPKPPR
jgi:hypothetical protein